MSLYLSATACGKDHIHRTETILDSGASRHAIRDRSIIQDYKANNGGNVYLGNGEAIKIQGEGIAKFDIGVQTLSASESLHIPDLAYI